MSQSTEWSQIGKIPPQAKEIEEAVIGALLVEKESFYKVSFLKPCMFYVYANELIYETIVSLDKANIPIDILTVTEALRKKNKLEEVGGAYYVTLLSSKVASSAHIEEHALYIQQKYVQRKAIELSFTIQSKAYDETEDISDTLYNAGKLIEEIQEELIGKSDIESLADLTAKAYEEIDRRVKLYNSGEQTGINTGLCDMNRITSGWQKSELVIIAARPAMGKTNLALHFAKSAAKEGNSVVMFSLEMSKLSLYNRFLVSESDINPDLLKSGRLNSNDYEIINSGADNLYHLPIYIDDNASITMSYIRAKCRLLKKRSKCDMVIIDYLQLISSTKGKSTNREQEIASMSREAKLLAKELDIPVLLLSQLSRKVEDKADKRPDLSCLRECLSTDTSLIYGENSIQHNVDSKLNLLSLHNNKIENMESNNIPKKSNEVYRIRTKTGRFIDCTLNHPVLTTSGYKKVSELSTLDSLAVVRGWNCDKGKYIPESRFIGWMLGNGCSYGYNSPSFITSDKRISDDFCSFIFKKWGFYPKFHKHYKSKVYQWDITYSRTSPKGGNIVANWLKDNDLWGRKSYDKIIPDWFITKADRNSILELLQGLWETDGCIGLGKRQNIQYSTTSYIMAQQIIYLLAKVGIIANLDSGYLSSKATTKCYKIIIDNSSEKFNFIKTIKLSGDKGNKIKKIKCSNRFNYLNNKINRDTTENIAEIVNSIKNKKMRIQIHGDRRLTVPRLKQAISLYPNELSDFRWIVNDNIFWDSISSIEAIGVKKVFDRNVPNSHNFVVNGIIVHNSGAIEQDADMVLFIYRPDYYGLTDANGNSLKNEGKIIIAKNRNGQVADVKFRHNDSLTKIYDYDTIGYSNLIPPDNPF